MTGPPKAWRHGEVPTCIHDPLDWCRVFATLLLLVRVAAGAMAPAATAPWPSLAAPVALHYDLEVRFATSQLQVHAQVAIRATIATRSLEFRLAPSLRSGDLSVGGETYRPVAIAPGLNRVVLVAPWAAGSLHVVALDYGGTPPAPDVVAPQRIALWPGTRWYPTFSPAGRFTAAIRFHCPPGLRGVARGELVGTDAAHWQSWRDDGEGRELALFAAPLVRTDRASPGLTVTLFASVGAPAAATVRLRDLAAAVRRAYQQLRRRLGPAPERVLDINLLAWSAPESPSGDSNFFVVPASGVTDPADLRFALYRGVADWWWNRAGLPAWLQSGLDTICALKIAAAESGLAARDIWLPRLQAAAQAARGPLAAAPSVAADGPSSLDAAATARAARGAMVLNALRLQIGDRRFAALLRRFAADRAGDAAAFERLAAGVAGQPLDWFWRQWLERASLPRIDFEWRPMRLPRSGQTIRVSVRQPAPAFAFRAPILVVAGGREYWQFIAVRDTDTILGIPVKGTVDSVQFDPRDELLRAAPQR